MDSFIPFNPIGSRTVNKTFYKPYMRRPAPVFIASQREGGDTVEADIQLGV